jgi:hypothetical protein
VIYISNPAFGTRGLYVTIVRALGAQPRYLKAELMAQASDLLAAETAERHRRVVVPCDEAHLLHAGSARRAAAPDELRDGLGEEPGDVVPLGRRQGIPCGGGDRRGLAEDG